MTANENDDRQRNVAKQARYWVVRRVSGGMDDEEWRHLEEWLRADPSHADAYRRERVFWKELSVLEDRFTTTVWPPKQGANWRSLLAMAACLVLVVLVAGLMPEGDVRTSAGEIRTVTLPDGSRATLDSDSAFDIEYRDDRRRVELRHGRVWFEVAPNARRPFEVGTDAGVARAVGTAFEVSVLGDGASVLVTEGVVSVRSPEGAHWRPAVVRAGQRLTYSPGRPPGPVTSVDVDQALAWSRGRLDLENRSLAAALVELDRYRPGRILLFNRAAGERPVSAMLALEHLDQGLDALAQSEGLQVVRLTPYLTVLY